jgi:anti-sigma factor RsiW
MRDDINRRPRWMGTTLTAAFAVMALMALLMIWGPWSPRLVHRDMAGNDIGTSTRTLSP